IQISEHSYSLTHKWKSNVLTNFNKSTTIKTSTLAFMNDILWIANSREDLDQIIHIADSFYQLNFTKMNWEKSVLLTKRNDNDNTFTCNIN
ncbi:7238_t:CDS:1, partial [Funneliformis geosporum]